MDNLRATIELLFARGNVETVLDTLPGVHTQTKNNPFDQNRFREAHQNDFDKRYTDDQVNNLFQIADKKWCKPLDQGGSPQENHPLYALLHFASHALRETDDQPRCRFEHLLRWREMTLKLGEDLFTTAFLAHRDLSAARERTHFGWPAVLGHDNATLNELFEREKLNELHFHLNGSTQVFDLNWLCLMNHIKHHSKAFKNLSELQKPDVLFTQSEQRASLRALTIKAAALRAYLFEKLIANQKPKPELLQIVHEKDDKQVLFCLTDLQCQIDWLSWQYGRRYGRDLVDYAIPKNLPHRETSASYLADTVLHGERRLLYHAFKYVFQCQEDYLVVSTYLYAYLIAKNRIRKELVQLNDRIGFQNFKTYQDRKECFVLPGSVYEKLVSNLAINSSLAPGTTQYIEARIVPKATKQETIKTIEVLDRRVDDRHFVSSRRDPFVPYKPDPKHHYVLHFIKQQDKGRKNHSEEAIRCLVQCRHHKLREQVKQQTFALNDLLRSLHSARQRVVGIDAASSEIGCRPEVFATAFRYLKNYSHNPEGQYLGDYPCARLGVTYHVGEDFLDPVDGLRAVDEALLFLNLGQGDRIGHGLVLGLDVVHFYEHRNRRVVMSAQDFLDNTAWLYNMIPTVGFADSERVRACLKTWFDHYFDLIYGGLKPSTPETYHRAWRLRGNDPIHYKSEQAKSPVFISFWAKSGLNTHEGVENGFTPDVSTIVDLYRRYHFDPEVRKRGAQMVEHEVDLSYIRAVEAVQQLMRSKVYERHILIETNPSSNYVIGEHKRYDRHPMLRFFNQGLADSKLECPQIHISIGTDDKGVFATSLEQEYSLMALSLEKMCDADDRPIHTHAHIRDWLSHTIRMSKEYRFKE